MRLIVIPFLLLATTAARAAEDRFRDDIRPLLKTHCFRCHGLEKTKGKVNLVQFEEIAEFALHDRLWQGVIEQLESGEMPPEDEPQPPKELLAGIRALLADNDPERLPLSAPRVGPQRLNRQEYANTLQDLLGIQLDIESQLPADGGGGEGFDNTASALFLSPLLLERYLSIASQAADAALAKQPDLDVIDFANRAYRRPLTDTEIARLKAAAPHLAIVSTLSSPKFLFREIDAPDGVLSPHSLATRLAYFLTASTPDAELRALADSGELRSQQVLEEQARRLLRSSQSARFFEPFVSQWLQTKALKQTVWPDRGKFPHYDEHLADVFYREPIAMFAHLVAENRPITELVLAEYSFVNQRLARWYGNQEVQGEAFRKVAMDPKRGGLLGMGGVMAITSFPLRSSPVLRGKWVLDTLLGVDLPPPPPNVEALPDDERPVEGKSIRQRLEAHRTRAECAGCHSKIDPIGFALENFDPVGSWRDQIHGQPVDAAGTLPGGETFRGPGELKTILGQRREAFARNVVERLLAYGLGRGIEPADTPAIHRILKQLDAQGYRMQDAILAVVDSHPFRHQDP
jgi:hypothetical protein